MLTEVSECFVRYARYTQKLSTHLGILSRTCVHLEEKKARFYTTVGEEWYYVDLHSDLEKRECCSLPKRIQKGAKRMREHTRLPSDPCTSSSSHCLAIFFNTFACDAKPRLSLNHGRLWVHLQHGIRVGHRLLNIQRSFVFCHRFLRVTRKIFEQVVV